MATRCIGQCWSAIGPGAAQWQRPIQSRSFGALDLGRAGGCHCRNDRGACCARCPSRSHAQARPANLNQTAHLPLPRSLCFGFGVYETCRCAAGWGGRQRQTWSESESPGPAVTRSGLAGGLQGFKLLVVIQNQCHHDVHGGPAC